MILKLIGMQSRLDDHINREKNLTEPHLEEKLLALLTELGEMANEWRRFKVWSVDREPRKGLKEEYIDVLHFSISAGNVIHVDPDLIFLPVEYGAEQSYEDVRKQIFLLYAAVGQYGVNEDFPLYTWESIISEVLHLGTMLGYSRSEILEAYIQKNEVNHKRQSENY